MKGRVRIVRLRGVGSAFTPFGKANLFSENAFFWRNVPGKKIARGGEATAKARHRRRAAPKSRASPSARWAAGRLLTVVPGDRKGIHSPAPERQGICGR